MPHLAGLRDVPQVGDQPVADVDHRGRAELGGRADPRAYGGSGRRCASTKARRRAEAAREHGQPGRGPAEPAGDGDDVAGPGAGAGDRLLVAQVAERGDRPRMIASAADDVAADHARRRRPGTRRGCRPSARCGQVDRQVRRARRGRAAARSAPRPSRRCRRGSARRPCGRRRRRWTSPGGSAGPPPAGRSGHHPAVRRGHHRRVVARAEQDRRVLVSRGQLPDEPELPRLSRSSPQCSRTSPSRSADSAMLPQSGLGDGAVSPRRD